MFNKDAALDLLRATKKLLPTIDKAIWTYYDEWVYDVWGM